VSDPQRDFLSRSHQLPEGPRRTTRATAGQTRTGTISLPTASHRSGGAATSGSTVVPSSNGECSIFRPWTSHGITDGDDKLGADCCSGAVGGSLQTMDLRFLPKWRSGLSFINSPRLGDQSPTAAGW
uniref:Uncharacterized protein n=1 Tax=Neogobius melanostomus TaxID=47308 RepID=A0A8C6U6Z4_9GOBI